jgi:hypothetical protein
VYCSSHSDLHLCLFCWASNTMNLDLKFFTLVDLIIFYIQNFNLNFFKTFKFRFQIFQKTSSLELESHMSTLDSGISFFFKKKRDSVSHSLTLMLDGWLMQLVYFWGWQLSRFVKLTVAKVSRLPRGHDSKVGLAFLVRLDFALLDRALGNLHSTIFWAKARKVLKPAHNIFFFWQPGTLLFTIWVLHHLEALNARIYTTLSFSIY